MIVMKIIKVKGNFFVKLKTNLFKVKLNMQKSLAMQIQEITQELRLQQKKLLENLNKFQQSKKNAYDFEAEDQYNKFAKNTSKLQKFENQV